MKLLARLALAALATLLLTELLLRGYRAFVGQVPPHEDPSVSAEWEWARDHLAAGVPRIGHEAKYDPALGWTTPPKIRAARGSRFRFKRSPGTPRVVLVGDSFTREVGTFGEAFQPEWEVVNLAVQGYGAGQAGLRFRLHGVHFRPDVAVFGFYLRDYFRTFRSFRGYAKPTFSLGPDGRLVVGNSPVPSPEALYEAYRSGERRIGRPGRSYLWDSFVERRAQWRLHHGGLRADQLAVLEAIFERFQDDARARGACPMLLVFPTRPDEYPGSVFEAIDLRAREQARALGLPYLALAEALYDGASAEARASLFDRGRGGHLTPHGRAEVARALHRFFDDTQLGACHVASGARAGGA